MPRGLGLSARPERTQSVQIAAQRRQGRRPKAPAVRGPRALSAALPCGLRSVWHELPQCRYLPVPATDAREVSHPEMFVW